MDYIIIPNISLYVFLFLFVCIALIGIIGLLASIYSDNKASKITELLYEEREKNIDLSRDNIRLKLKCGELKAGEKVDV